MDYEDFPILNNKNYDFINKKYENLTKNIENTYENQDFFNKNNNFINFDNEKIINSIYKNIIKIKNMCKNPQKIYNIDVCNCLIFCYNQFNKMEENLISTFKFSPINAEYLNLNIFSLLKNINNLLGELFFWNNNEKKDYFRNISTNFIYQIIFIQQKIYEILEKNNILFFKHM